MLSGYKTYVTGVLAILGFIAAYLVGEADLATTIQASVTAALAMTLRHGISTEGAKKAAPIILVGFALLAAGCQTSPGGYPAGAPEYDYDWAQETFIATVGNLLIAKQAGEISQEDWDKTVYPLIREGDETLDAMEAAVLAGNPSAVDVKLVVFRSVIQRLKLWAITGEPGASNGSSYGNPLTLTRTSGTGNRHLRLGLGRQDATPRVPGASQASSQGAGGTSWRGGHALAA